MADLRMLSLLAAALSCAATAVAAETTEAAAVRGLLFSAYEKNAEMFDSFKAPAAKISEIDLRSGKKKRSKALQMADLQPYLAD